MALTAAAAVDADEGIFNGKDLSGWKGSDGYWSANDGTIVGKSKTTLGRREQLWSTVVVKDFYLAADVKLTSANQAGGIQFRSSQGAHPSQAIGYQADMGHTKSHGNLWGRLYDEAGRGKLDWNTHGAKAVKPGDWNRYEILAVGHRVWTAVNGTLCTAVDDPQGELSGKIAFQLAPGPPQTIEIRIAAFAHDPKVKLAGLTEAQLVAKLNHLEAPKAAQTGKAAAVRAPAGLTVSVFADHPQITNPVAVDVDTNNRVYVAETFRFNRGTAENRTQSFMLEDDLQVQSLDDRMAMQRKWASRFTGGMDWFTSERDQINLLTDTDGDGRADTSSILATFREPLDGLVAGVLPWGNDIWVTCIPHLWRLRDADGDGKAEVTDKVLTGFGVRASFFGHDMHGLAVGPDNRLYFSVGDRGFNVTAKDGRVLKQPEQGAVFRCRRDGSGFEVLHRGMRNPQEIAFDEWGNLFAGDNNCDKGDKSRLIYVIDGGDSGWRMHYQSVAGTYRGGPWMHEGMWKRDDPDLTPAWLTPSAGYIGSGPSGLAYSAVGAWPEALRNRFYHCNFSRNRGIETFRAEPDGAGFRIVEYESFLAPARTADCAFGYDGRLYAAEFVGGPWGHADVGHIFAVHPPKTSEAALALTALAKADFSTFADPKLIELLSHDDQRLRLRAQDELAKRGKTAEFATLAADSSAALLPRVHAIWGLWQIGLDGHETPGLTRLVTDKNAEIRAQAWRVLGDLRRDVGTKALRRALGEGAARVQYFAARAVGRVNQSTLSGDLLALGGKTSDPIVQQAVVIALSRLGEAQAMIDLARADNPKTRMIALLTLRQLGHRQVTAFLGDADDRIVVEAARAAHDLGIKDTEHQLAQALERAAAIKGRRRLPMLRRVITANRIAGDAAAARRLCGMAVDDPDKTVRELSLQALESWGTTVNRDPVTGEWRPIAPADNAVANAAMTDVAKQLFAADRRDLWATAIRACQGLEVALPIDALERIVEDPKSPLGARQAAFNKLAGQAPDRAAAMGAKLLAQPKQDGRLAKTIHAFLASSDRQRATPIFGRLTVDDAASIAVRQSAIAALTASKTPAAHDALRPLFDLWRAGKAPPGLLVELQSAAAVFKEAAPASDDAVLHLLHGGDADRGRELFVNHQAAQCIRCHRLTGIRGGGDAGPSLNGVAKRLSGPQLVEALVNPGARIAPGFGIVSVTRKDGTTVAGVLRAETAAHLEIAIGDKPPVRVAVADIASRTTPVSAMPPMGAILKPHEIRDLVAFLATTGGPPAAKKPIPPQTDVPAQARPLADRAAGVNVPGLRVSKGSKPNIIFVLCDDLGAGDIGVLWQNQRQGTQKFSTPNLDQFAKEGLTLNRHYCPAPSCVASRASLITGRHQGHSAIRDFQFDAPLPQGHTLGTVMQKAGYATTAIGKWGMAGGPFQLKVKPARGDRSPETNPSHPTLRGFDYFYGYTAHRDAHYHYPKLGNRPFYDGFVDVTDRLAKCYSTDLLTARTKKWIIDHRKANPQQPFFTYLCYTAPHAGLRIPTSSHLTATGNYPEGGGLNGGVQWLDDAANGQINTAKGTVDEGMHPEVADAVGDDGEPWPDYARRHATMVRRVDDALADLIQLLKDLKIDDNTLVILSSDNGTLREAGLDKVGYYFPNYLDTFGRYDGMKLDLWDGGVRMPTFVRWPDVIQAGRQSNAASQFHDWMPTFCDLAGLPAPAVSDGVSIAPTLTGRGEQARGIVYSEFKSPGRTPDFAEYEPSRRNQPRGQMQLVLIGDYKGVRVNIKDYQSVFEVYHTVNDPKEARNLAGTAGVPTQKQFQDAVLRLRRSDQAAPRPYDNAAIPAVTGVTTRPGLQRKTYPGSFDWVPQFDQRKPSGLRVVKGLDATSGAQQFVGYLRVPKSGVYHFALTTNGKAVVRLHNTLLIDADSQYIAGSRALSGEIVLQAGLHPLRINYLAAAGDVRISVQWQPPGEQMKPMSKAQFCIQKGPLK